MANIIVTQSKKIQKRVLKIAAGMSIDDIQHVIDSMDCNDHRFSSGESQKVWKAYIAGWRGNDVANALPLTPTKTGFIGRIKNAVNALRGL